MECRIILGSDEAFKKVKAELIQLFNNRQTDELHTLEIKPYKKDRTNQQSRYYRGFVVRPFAKHCGYTEAEMHDELLGNYFGWKIIRSLDGRERERPTRRTTEPEKMSTKDFAEYVTHCQALAASLGINLEPYEEHLNG